jgi:hypothetical protein
MEKEFPKIGAFQIGEGRSEKKKIKAMKKD